MLLLRILFFVAFCPAVAVHSDRGIMKNCGDEAHKFDGWWEPNPVVTHQNLTVQVSFMPAVNAKNLNAAISITFEGITIFKGQKQMPCSPLPICPIVAAKSTIESITTPLDYSAPKGHYVIQVNITNDDGAPLLCAVVDTRVVHSQFKLWPKLAVEYGRS